jgi:hypothetical protein
VCVCACVCMYVRMNVCMYVRIYVLTYVRMYVCMYANMHREAQIIVKFTAPSPAMKVFASAAFLSRRTVLGLYLLKCQNGQKT